MQKASTWRVINPSTTKAQSVGPASAWYYTTDRRWYERRVDPRWSGTISQLACWASGPRFPSVQPATMSDAALWR